MIRKVFLVGSCCLLALSQSSCTAEKSNADVPAEKSNADVQVAEKGDQKMQDAAKIKVVQEMITAWNEREWDKIADLFTDDGVLHSMMIQPVVGRETIRKRIVGLGEGLDQITLNIKNIGIVGEVVVIERVDEFTYKGRKGSVPVVGVLEVEGDKVKEWREYYDRAELLEAMGLSQDFDPKAQ